MRIGQGFDVHALTPGDGLTIGGVFIDCGSSFIAHSDGDVLIHALCDALLGAMARGDIGQLFPDTSALHKDRDSREFLCEIKTLMDDDGYQIVNADMTIIAQAPKMAPHIAEMCKNIAIDLAVELSCVNIKATTTEKLGFCGRAEGIAASACVLLEKKS
ncbi:MAG: 2-C-methyl-D-erythritol 2,4-cyclodiphosphate synthase [Gammaproteobacteria bacterium]|nr:2-C-methyl-D-erythritol 2,4-cyclodiphosphate synthase [Gammaproteobacteria bacterium]